MKRSIYEKKRMWCQLSSRRIAGGLFIGFVGTSCVVDDASDSTSDFNDISPAETLPSTEPPASPGTTTPPDDAITPADPTEAAGDDDTAEVGTTPGDPTEVSGDDDTTEVETTPAPPLEDCAASFLLDAVNSYQQTGNYPDPFLEVSCDDPDFIRIESNGIPNFEFDQVTPNELREQNLHWTLPRNPELAVEKSPVYTTGEIGITVTGLSIYAPNEAPNDGYADPYLDNILDYCNGHTDQAGRYHFHARANCLFEEIEGQAHLVIGYAFDGFAIVAPFECSNDDCLTTYEVSSSYVYVGGSDNAYESNQYVEGSGDLDECNGMIAPDGEYRYYSTDTFPYYIGCYSGTPEDSNNPNGETANGTDDGGDDDDGNGGPVVCDDTADCVNACPDGSVGCTCATHPDGTRACTPTCSRDSDCVDDPNQDYICDEGQGLCVPANGP